MKLFPSAVF